ncbi:MAG: hypothetical protein WCK51_14365 [Armatimonadota bacterium]
MKPLSALRWKLLGAILVLGLVIPLLSCGTCVTLGGGMETKPDVTNTALFFWLGSWVLGGTIALGWVIWEICRAISERLTK